MKKGNKEEVEEEGFIGEDEEILSKEEEEKLKEKLKYYRYMKPNIIIIIVDALRPRNLSLFNYNKETDKNLKAIAKENIFFKNHFSVANSTAPSLAALFTGKYPPNNGILHQVPYTKQEEITKFEENKFWFPSYMKEKGCNTLGVDWFGMWFKKGFENYQEKKEGLLKKSLKNLLFDASF